jgi:hypothetical protein
MCRIPPCSFGTGGASHQWPPNIPDDCQAELILAAQRRVIDNPSERPFDRGCAESRATEKAATKKPGRIHPQITQISQMIEGDARPVLKICVNLRNLWMISYFTQH